MSKRPITVKQIDVLEGLEATLVANKIAQVVMRGEGLPESHFDYGDVPQENRNAVLELTKTLKVAVRRHFEAIVEIGTDLLEAKELLGHGNFLPWLKAEFQWSERTARNYMDLAEWFQGKTAKFADLDQRTAKALIAAPAEIRDSIFARANAGSKISRAEVQSQVISLHRQPDSPPTRDGTKHIRLSRVSSDPISATSVLSTAELWAEGAHNAAKSAVGGLAVLPRQIERCGGIDGFFSQLTDGDREKIRDGLEAAVRLRAALDEREQPQRIH